MEKNMFFYWINEIRTSIVGANLNIGEDYEEELAAFDHIAEEAAKSMGHKMEDQQ